MIDLFGCALIKRWAKSLPPDCLDQGCLFDQRSNSRSGRLIQRILLCTLAEREHFLSQAAAIAWRFHDRICCQSLDIHRSDGVRKLAI